MAKRKRNGAALVKARAVLAAKRAAAKRNGKRPMVVLVCSGCSDTLGMTVRQGRTPQPVLCSKCVHEAQTAALRVALRSIA